MGEESRRRKRYFKVHLLDEELSLLDMKADEASMSKSEFIRNMILFGAAHERTMFSKEDSRALIYELNRIGNNVNQIAVRVNTNRAVDERDFQSLRDNFLELLGAYDDFIRGKGNGNY